MKENMYEELEKKIDENYDKIIANMNKLHSHEEKIENNTQRINQNSYALEILRDYKISNKRQFAISVIIAVCLFITLAIMLFK